MRYSLLLLDADGTLFDYERAEASAMASACNDHGIEYDEAKHLPVYRRINEAMWRALERGEIDQDALAIERFSRFFAEIGANADVRSFSGRYLEHLSRGSFLLPGAEEVVTTLAGTHPLVVVTNGLSRVQRERLARSPIAGHFDHVVISDEVGARKPEPGIFDAAMAPFPDIPARETLMVGDSLTSDIAGAVGYGLDVCWYNPTGVANEAGPAPTYEIFRLPELLDLVYDRGGA